MKVKFIGDPREGAKPEVPDEMTAFGLTLERGKWADTADLPAKQRKAAELKFAGNDHFETKGDVPEPEPAPEPVRVVSAAVPADPTVPGSK